MITLITAVLLLYILGIQTKMYLLQVVSESTSVHLVAICTSMILFLAVAREPLIALELGEYPAFCPSFVVGS